MRRTRPNITTATLLGFVIALSLDATTAEARSGSRSDDNGVGDIVDRSARSLASDDSPDGTAGAASFFAACPNVHVTRETVVNGQASVVGDCTITVETGHNLDLREVDLMVLGTLTIEGGGDVDVNIGDANCPDGQICAGSRIDATGLLIALSGRDSRARVFFSSIRADTIDIVTVGTEAEVRVHNSTLDSMAYIMLVAAGTDALMRVDVVNEAIDRNSLAASVAIMRSEGHRSETRVNDTDFQAQRVEITSAGEARAERNAFDDANVMVAGADDCRSRDNIPSVSCD